MTDHQKYEQQVRQTKLSTSDKRKKQENSYPRLALVVEQSTRQKEMLTICAQIAPFGPSYTKKRGHVIIRYVARQLLCWELRDQLLFAAATLIGNSNQRWPCSVAHNACSSKISWSSSSIFSSFNWPLYIYGCESPKRNKFYFACDLFCRRSHFGHTPDLKQILLKKKKIIWDTF